MALGRAPRRFLSWRSPPVLLGRGGGETRGWGILKTRFDMSHRCQAHRFEPRCVLRHTENAPRHLVLGLDAECVNRPTTAGPRADPRSQWQTRQQFYSTLDLSPTGHMPGYTGHISQYKYSNPGQRFAKSTMGSLPSSHPSLSVELFRG